MESLMYAGMDVHKATIEISIFKARHKDPEFERQLPNAPKQIRTFFEKLRKQGPIIACYEAGCMGFGLHRMLKEMNIPCQVVAPGLLPRKPGERIKNDRRDSRKLARNLRNGEVTPIYIPSEEDEAVRDYLRMFEDLKLDRKKARQRLLHFLLRHKIVYTAGKNWTVKHEQWLRSIQFENPMLKETFAEYFFHIKELDEKALRVKDKIEEIALSEPYKDKVARLRCLKGIETLTAISLVTEIGDFRRFMKAEEFMAFLGLVPSEVSSGPKRKQGGITKAGNSHLRKLLVEAGWHYRIHNATSKRLAARRSGQPASIIAYANKAGRRLNKKFNRLSFKHKKAQIIVTAVARELSGFVWGLMVGEIT